MTGLAGTLAAVVLTWAALFAATSAVVTLAWPRVARRVALVARPATRARRLLAVSVAPLALPTLVVGAVLLPGLSASLGGSTDHCLAHAEHPHLCLAHPGIAWSPLLGLALVATLAIALPRLVAALRRGACALAASARLRALPSAPLAPDTRRIESHRALCFTAGLVRPSIRVSDGLWRALTDAQRAVVLAHERAHVRRRDPLGRAIAAVGTLGVGPRARRSLLDALARASERACDESAAAAVGERLRVAETLLAVERVIAAHAGHAGAGGAAPAFAETALEERVRALIDDPEAGDATGPAPGTVVATSALLVCAPVLLALPLHHAIEHAFELLVTLVP